MSFQDTYGLREKPEIPCDYECPRCGGPIIHKQSDWRNVPSAGYIMDWYICEASTCECSWVPDLVKKWNERPKEERERIRELRKLYKRLKEVIAELDKLDAWYEEE
jgi:ssDNA-binding Zn-finger/Zn-ribbon topoisomerase 1